MPHKVSLPCDCRSAGLTVVFLIVEFVLSCISEIWTLVPLAIVELEVLHHNFEMFFSSCCTVNSKLLASLCLCASLCHLHLIGINKVTWNCMVYIGLLTSNPLLMFFSRGAGSATWHGAVSGAGSRVQIRGLCSKRRAGASHHESSGMEHIWVSLDHKTHS